MHRKQRRSGQQIVLRVLPEQDDFQPDRLADVQSWLDRLMHFWEWFIVRITLLVLVLIGACTVLAPHIKEFVHFVVQLLKP
jgi:membrane protein required for beta-lactamase induction